MEEIRTSTILRTFASPKRACRIRPPREHPFLTAATMIGHAEEAAQGGELRRGSRLISLAKIVAGHALASLV